MFLGEKSYLAKLKGVPHIITYNKLWGEPLWPSGLPRAAFGKLTHLSGTSVDQKA